MLGTKERDKAGVPGVKKLEMTGKNSFVVHADGGNHFEGVITDPSKVKLKGSGKIFFTNEGKGSIDESCMVCVNNKYRTEEVAIKEICDSCKNHKSFKTVEHK